MEVYSTYDESTLKSLLDASTDFNERRGLRAALRQLRGGGVKRAVSAAAADWRRDWTPSPTTATFTSNAERRAAWATRRKLHADTVSENIRTLMQGNLEDIDNEDTLYEMLHECREFEERRKIRAALRKLRERKKAASEESENKAKEKDNVQHRTPTYGGSHREDETVSKETQKLAEPVSKESSKLTPQDRADQTDFSVDTPRENLTVDPATGTQDNGIETQHLNGDSRVAMDTKQSTETVAMEMGLTDNVDTVAETSTNSSSQEITAKIGGVCDQSTENGTGAVQVTKSAEDVQGSRGSDVSGRAEVEADHGSQVPDNSSISAGSVSGTQEGTSNRQTSQDWGKSGNLPGGTVGQPHKTAGRGKETGVKGLDIQELKRSLSDWELKLEETKDFDKRRDIRSAIRELRMQIREGTRNVPKRTQSARVTYSITLQQPSSPRPRVTPRQITLPANANPGAVPARETTKEADAKVTFLGSVNGSMAKGKTSSPVTGRKGRTYPCDSDDTKKCDSVIHDDKYNNNVISTETTSKLTVKTLSQSKKSSLPNSSADIDSITVDHGEQVNGTGKVDHAGKLLQDDSTQDSSQTICDLDKSTDVKAKSDLEANVKSDGTDNGPVTPGLTSREGEIGKSSEETDGTNGQLSADSCIDQSAHSQGEHTVETEGPDIHQPLQDVTAVDGKAVSLKCGVKVGDGAEITWFHDAKVLEPGEDFQQTFTEGVACLDIKEVFPDDAGQYRCVVKLGDTVAESSATLTVEENAEFSVPAVMEALCDHKAQDGDTVVLTCRMTGKPEVTITWYKDSKLLKSNADFKQTYDGELARLAISEVYPDDTGTYCCEAANCQGTAQTECVLTVSDAADTEKPTPEAPQFKGLLMPQEVNDGERVELSCEVTGAPKPVITWLKNNKILKNCSDFRQSYDGKLAQLIIEEALPEDSGDYTATATNSEGEDSVMASLIVLEGSGSGKSRQDVKHSRAETKAVQPVEGDHSKDKTPPAAAKASSEKTPITPGDKKPTKSAPHSKVESRVQLTPESKMASTNVETIEDEELLHKMLNQTENFDERKKIRHRLRELREAHTREWERKRAEREAEREDAIKMRQRQAEAEKQRKMQEFKKMASEHVHRKDLGGADAHIRQKHAQAELEKQKKLEQYKELGASAAGAYGHSADQITLKKPGKEEAATFTSTKTETGPDGRSTTTTTTTTTQKSKDGSTTVTKQSKQVTQVAGFGGTSYNINKPGAEETAEYLVEKLDNQCADSTSGVISIKTEAWNSVDGTTRRTAKTQTIGGGKPQQSAMAAFKSMDAAAGGGAKPNFLSAGGGGGKVSVQRSPSTIKQMLLDWCKAMTKGYEHVDIQNFSSSWNNGMAFCALIHHFHPEAFDYSKLNPKARRGNFKLAFDVAEKYADITPLLEVDDMVRMKNPDWKCVFTQVQMYYRKFRDYDKNKHVAGGEGETK